MSSRLNEPWATRSAQSFATCANDWGTRLTNAVFEKTFKASDKFKEPDLQSVETSYLYSDGDGSHFLDQESFETLTLTGEMVGIALDFLMEGAGETRAEGTFPIFRL